MAVQLEFFSLIIPIKKIEEYYPGGFEEFKEDHHSIIGGRMWYDEYLVRDGAMNPMDIEFLVNQWESYGLKGIMEMDGKSYWKDMCVIDYFSGPTLDCDWLLLNGNSVSHINDDSKIIINRYNTMDSQITSFNAIEWLKKFKEASKNKIGFRELRVEIYQLTLQIVKQKNYVFDKKEIQLDNDKLTKETVFYTKPEQLTPSKNEFQTKFSVIEADCIEVGQLLKNAGYDVCLLNMANRQNPGGGVLGGAGAQEENVFRRSNLLSSLYQFAPYSMQYGIRPNEENSYPLDRNSGGIHSKDVTIFRGSEPNGYCLLKNPFQLSVVSVPAINRPPLHLMDGKYRITDDLIEPSKEKIRTILRISGAHHHDCLVLSAFGCGAFHNPPKHMAELFREVCNEPEFINQFKLIVFAIIDDHNAWQEHNPEGNFLPFYREFENEFI